jgi:predicted nuclease of predicted toxin-antitoxin system
VKLLIDNCFSQRFAFRVAGAGHDVVWAGEWGADPGDEVILARALAGERVLVTKDNHFGNLVFLRQRRHAGVVRLSQMSSTASHDALLAVLEIHSAELLAGAFVTVTAKRIRIHRSPYNPPA